MASCSCCAWCTSISGLESGRERRGMSLLRYRWMKRGFSCYRTRLILRILACRIGMMFGLLLGRLRANDEWGCEWRQCPCSPSLRYRGHDANEYCYRSDRIPPLVKAVTIKMDTFDPSQSSSESSSEPIPVPPVVRSMSLVMNLPNISFAMILVRSGLVLLSSNYMSRS